MRVALYQPDQPGNLGAVIRLCACFGAGLDVIGPCGFPLGDKALRRAAMDYGALCEPVFHPGWEAFVEAVRGSGARLCLATTRASVSLYDVGFRPDDILLFGRESAGAPGHVHDAADLRLRIPMRPAARSLNLAQSCAIALSEALRQTGRTPPMES